MAGSLPLIIREIDQSDRSHSTPAQWSTLFDRTGGLWAKGALVGKFCGIFTSTASQHGCVDRPKLDP